MWFQTVVPSMLPFFILNHLLSAAGGVQLIGRIFEKPVRKFLKLPGEAAFILATGYSTGVPLSAALIADLRKKDRLSKDRGQRLLAFAANVSPGFLFSAVAVAMLERAEIGLFLAAVHYGSNLILTVLCTLFSREKQELALIPRHSEETPFSLMSVLTEAVERGLKTVFLIGGIILSFRILIAAVEECELISLLCDAL
ncbi:MAG: hypothetical protein IKV45_02895, partial [Firmicutes bacterium]|nr:hypothetical protein [Bacillota bacterium]